jgi:hypothetical protein
MPTPPVADVSLPVLLTWSAPIIGLAAAGLTFVVGRAVLAGRKARAAAGGPGAAAGPAADAASSDPFIFGSTSERRIAARREGNTVEVLIADRDATTAPLQGWVVDRSVGGLGLRTDVPLPVGAAFNIRPHGAGTIVPWTEVEVKSCRQNADGWEIGCQFVRTPPWSVLLLFG